METLPKLHFACSDDQLRPIFSHILVTKDEIVATDAHILVVFKTKSIFTDQFIHAMPERFLIHKNHWKEMCKRHHQIIFKDNVITVIQDGYTNIYPIVIERDGLKYVNYQAVIPKFEEKKEIDCIGVSFDKIEMLSKSMFFPNDIKNVKLTFFEKTRSILVNPVNDDNGQFGIIMPIHIEY